MSDEELRNLVHDLKRWIESNRQAGASAAGWKDPENQLVATPSSYRVCFCAPVTPDHYAIPTQDIKQTVVRKLQFCVRKLSSTRFKTIVLANPT
jgi:hypothetical protein